MIAFDFSGQTALVTGGTRGIGRAIAAAFLNAGARVVALYAGNEAAASEFKGAMGARAEKLVLKKCDVARYEDVEALFKELEPLLPDGLQIAVNNSGIRKDAVLAMMNP